MGVRRSQNHASNTPKIRFSFESSKERSPLLCDLCARRGVSSRERQGQLQVQTLPSIVKSGLVELDSLGCAYNEVLL